MGVSYPPEPWDLHGQAVASVFLVPVRSLPAPPPGTRVVSVAGRAVVTAAFFRYEEPSPLVYDEVMATVLVRRGVRPRVWIPWIWVDSEGGRSVVTSVRGRLRAQLLRTSWTFSGPLSLLAGRRPVVSVRASRFRLLFGRG